jgi:putative transposase
MSPVILSVVCLVVRRLLELAVLLGRCEASKEVEILVPRHELAVLRRQVPRPRHERRDRLLLAALSRLLPRSRWQAFLVTPQTVLRRTGICWPAAGHVRAADPNGRGPGRRSGTLVLRLAGESPNWGIAGSRGKLPRLDYPVAPSTMSRPAQCGRSCGAPG